MPTSIRSIIIENITWLSGLALSQGEVSRIIGVSKGVISNVLRRVCERAVSPRGAWVDFFKSSHIYIYVYILNTITSKEDRALLIMRRKSYSQGPGSEWNWSGELDTTSFPYSPGTCSCSWILLKTSKTMPQTDSSSSLLPPHVVSQFPNWNSQHWSSAIFDNDESKVSLYYIADGFHPFLRFNDPLAFPQNYEKLGTPIAFAEADYWLISK